MDDKTYNLSRSELYERAASLGPSVGIDKDSLLALLAYKNTPGESNAGNAVTNDFKIHLRIARQNGIHVSPTVLINGLADLSIQSSWDMDTWDAYLAKLA